MAVAETAGIAPVLGFALVGVLGVGSQWLAWRLRLPAIVLMLLAGLAVGPGLGVLDPSEDFGSLMQPMLAIAVAIILFEGGMTLNFESLSDAATGVRRLVLVGGPLGWAASSAALHWGVGISWETSSAMRRPLEPSHRISHWLEAAMTDVPRPHERGDGGGAAGKPGGGCGGAGGRPRT